MTSGTSQLDGLTPHAAWKAVRRFAERARRTTKPVPTLTRDIPNRIVAVDDHRIRRWSPAGKTNSSYVSQAAVHRAWRVIARPGGGSPPGLYFTRALLVHALPGLVRHADGRMWLAGDPVVARAKQRRQANAKQALKGRAGGESPLHKALKQFILTQPNQALAALPGGPFVGHDTEYIFPTGDEVDVYLTDCHGKPVLVEVKPDTAPDNLAPWGQAAKYRTLWSFFKDVPEGDVRVVVAAPRIPKATASRMAKRHRILSVAVRVPTRAHHAATPLDRDGGDPSNSDGS